MSPHETSTPPTPPDARFAEATAPLMGDLLAIARRILGDDDFARDAVQEALLGLWLGGASPENLRGWLARAVVHRSLHLARGRSRRRRHEDRARLVRPEPSDRDDPSRRLERDDLRRVVRESLAEIAPGHRDVLVLGHLEQKDYGSIAAELRVPVGTVRSRLNRSRRALREALVRRFPEGIRAFA